MALFGEKVIAHAIVDGGIVVRIAEHVSMVEDLQSHRTLIERSHRHLSKALPGERVEDEVRLRDGEMKIECERRLRR